MMTKKEDSSRGLKVYYVAPFHGQCGEFINYAIVPTWIRREVERIWRIRKEMSKCSRVFRAPVTHCTLG